MHEAVMADLPDLSAHQVYAWAPAMIEVAQADFFEKCALPLKEFFADAFHLRSRRHNLMNAHEPAQFSRTTYPSRFLNKNRAITANRLVVHAPASRPWLKRFAGCTDHWPGCHGFFEPRSARADTDLLGMADTGKRDDEIPAQTLAHPMTPGVDEGPARGRSKRNVPGLAFAGDNARRRYRLALRPDRRAQTPAPDSDASLSLARGFPIRTRSKPPSAWLRRGFGLDSFYAPIPHARSWHHRMGRSSGLMNLVRQNAEIRDIEAVLKQDVALSYKLKAHQLVGFGLMRDPVLPPRGESILGFNKLHKWLSLLLVTSSRDPRQLPLTQTAIKRGHFMDLCRAVLQQGRQ